jgi:L-ascorbate metabolism protein UlaG (beta-lactamase superfamily)
MKITYYGHSCFAAEIKGKHLLFDPFITDPGAALLPKRFYQVQVFP